MADEASPEAQLTKAPELDPDNRGYVTVTKGGVDAKIVPESWPVWEERGWELAAQESAEPAVPPTTPAPLNEDQEV